MGRAETQVIIALDTDDLEQAKQIVEITHEQIGIYKIGSILFTRFGPRAVEVAKQAGRDVFLDLKFHDIPNTVKGAVKAASALGVRLLTVHASGGEEMMKAALEGAKEGAETSGAARPRIVGVTMLTSLAAGRVTLERVLELSEAAARAGIDGVVCSSREVGGVKAKHGGSLLAVVPGIRLSDQAADDQARVGTPGQATRDGADYLVVGRSVTKAQDPQTALKRIMEEVKNA